jgi:hypothetical protein
MLFYVVRKLFANTMKFESNHFNNGVIFGNLIPKLDLAGDLFFRKENKEERGRAGVTSWHGALLGQPSPAPTRATGSRPARPRRG